MNEIAPLWENFEKVLLSWLHHNPPCKDGEVLKLKINGRMYWFAGLLDKHGKLYWRLLLKPNGVVTEREIL